MQLISRYLVKNRVDIVADVAGFVTEYRPVYKRQIQAYRGIDNIIEFRLLNADQKPINTQGYTIKFLAFNEDKNLIIEHEGIVLDDGSSTTKGLFTVTISENDLLNVQDQFLTYNIYLIDVDDKNVITYTDTHFGNDGVINVSSELFPGAKESKSINTFTNVQNDIYVSEAVDAEPGINGNEALHTAAVYTDGYVGEITIQGTLENQITDFTNWADLTTLVLDGSETKPLPINFNGVFKYIRFKTSNIPTNKITKILIRN